MRALLLVLFLSLVAESAAAQRRIVSTELCADQWLLQLARPSEIAGLSYQASLPALAVLHESAARFAAHNGSAEGILAMEPDVVLAGPWTSPRLLAMLERLGTPTHRLPQVVRLDQWEGLVRALGEILGAPPRAAKLLRDTLPYASPAIPLERKLTGVYHIGGYSSGAQTLADDMVRRAGGDNLGAQFGRGGWVHLPLEVLAASAPRLLVLDARPNATQLAGLQLRHPVLQKMQARTPTHFVDEPAWLCLTPATFAAQDKLTRAMEEAQ